MLPYAAEINIDYYTDGSLTFPKIPNSLIFIHNSRELAVEWVSRMGSSFEAWEVEASQVQIMDIIPMLPTKNEIIAFWRGIKPTSLMQMPTWGTPYLKMIQRIF